MSWRLGKSIRLRLQKGLQLWRSCDGEDKNRAWENFKENIKTLAKESLVLYELKQHTAWFDEECLGFLDQRKQAKIHWVQDPSQSNVDDLNNVRHEASRHFRNKKQENLKTKIEELETNSKFKILGTCIGTSMTLRRVTSLELI